MALKVKAKEREIKIGKNPGVYRYVMLPELYSTLDQDKVIKEAALRSGVTEGVMQACWDGAGKVIKAWLPRVTVWLCQVSARCASVCAQKPLRTSTM